MVKIPEDVLGYRTVPMGDGSFMLPRCTQECITFLSTDWDKAPRENRFFPKVEATVIPEPEIEAPGFGEDVVDLRIIFGGKTCVIASADNIDFENIVEGDPVILLSEGLERLDEWNLSNPVFVIHKDVKLKPVKTISMVLASQECVNLYKKAFIYSTSEIESAPKYPLVADAIQLARHLGAVGVELRGFEYLKGKSIYDKDVNETNFSEEARIILNCLPGLKNNFDDLIKSLELKTTL